MVGVSSPTSCRSRSTPAGRPWPVTVRTPSASSTCAPIKARIHRIASPGWVVRGRPRRDPDRAAGDDGGGQERRGVGQIRLDRAVDGATGPGSTRQVLAPLSSTTTPTARSISTVISMCGMDGTGLPVCTTVRPVPVARARQQQSGDELGRRRGVDPHRPAGQGAGSVQHERQGVAVDPGAQVAQRVDASPGIGDDSGCPAAPGARIDGDALPFVLHGTGGTVRIDASSPSFVSDYWARATGWSDGQCTPASPVPCSTTHRDDGGNAPRCRGGGG